MILYREPVNKVYCSDFSQTCRDARAAFSVGDVVSSPLAVIQGWKPGPLWTCDGGAIGVAPFLKASHLDYRRGLDAWHGFATGSRSCSSMVELGNDDQWWSFLWTHWEVTSGWPAMGSPSCWQLCFHARQRWSMAVCRVCAQSRRVGWLAPRVPFWLLGWLTFLYIITFFRLNWAAELLSFVLKKILFGWCSSDIQVPR